VGALRRRSDRDVIEHCREWHLGGGRSKGAGQTVDTLNSWREPSAARSASSTSTRSGTWIGWCRRGASTSISPTGHGADTALKKARWFFHREIGSRKVVRYGQVAVGDGTTPSFYKDVETRQSRERREYRLRVAVRWGPGSAGQIVRSGERLRSITTRRAGTSSTPTCTPDSTFGGSPVSLPFVGYDGPRLQRHEGAGRKLDEVLTSAAPSVLEG
jgi:hypothetical protein